VTLPRILVLRDVMLSKCLSGDRHFEGSTFLQAFQNQLPSDTASSVSLSVCKQEGDVLKYRGFY
jgi:hypothetical protein